MCCRMHALFSIAALVSIAALACLLIAEEPAPRPDNSPADSRNVAASGYVLGSDDQLTIRAVDTEELTDKVASIDMSGFVSLPLVGRIRAAGLTAEQFERELNRRLATYFHN